MQTSKRTSREKYYRPSDSRISDHIERRVIAPNVNPSHTHQNRELVRMPEGIRERDDAIAARISSAGIRRKITHDQVRAIRVMVSGTHEYMMEIEKAGRLDDWCRDSMDWLYRTVGRENVVSAVLHIDVYKRQGSVCDWSTYIFQRSIICPLVV